MTRNGGRFILTSFQHAPTTSSMRPGRFAARAAAVQRDVDATFDRGGKPDTGRG
jgi:hypothetical protein